MAPETNAESSPEPATKLPSPRQAYVAQCKGEFHERMFHDGFRHHIRYVRNDRGERIITLVAWRNRANPDQLAVSWSICNPKDRPDRYIGLEKATRKAYEIASSALTDAIEDVPHRYRDYLRIFVDDFAADPEAYIRTKPYQKPPDEEHGTMVVDLPG